MGGGSGGGGSGGSSGIGGGESGSVSFRFGLGYLGGVDHESLALLSRSQHSPHDRSDTAGFGRDEQGLCTATGNQNAAHCPSLAVAQLQAR